MHRLDRRIRILRGKRDGAFDPDQLYLERAFRARAARKLRFYLRRMQPAALITPRWSEARAFLDDLAVDLALGHPVIECRTLSMAPVVGRSVHESRAWIVRALTEFVGGGFSGPVSQAVERKGFRIVVETLLRRARTGPRRCLLVHQLEHLHVEALEDLVQVFESYVDTAGDDRRVNILFAGTVDVPSLELRGGVVVLADYSDVEALERLAEHTGPADKGVLQRAVDIVGGVPAMLERLGERAETRGGRLAENRDDLWKDLGALTDEIRGAVSIVNSEQTLAARFEEVAQTGPLPYNPDKDLPLVRAGVLQPLYSGLSARVMVRAPMFAEMALS